jgi:hypothetical protein
MILYEGGETLPAVQFRFSFLGRTGHPPSRRVRDSAGALSSRGSMPGKQEGAVPKNSKTSARGRGDNLYRGSKIFEKPPPKRPHGFLPPNRSSGRILAEFGGRIEFFSKSESMRVGPHCLGGWYAERVGNLLVNRPQSAPGWRQLRVVFRALPGGNARAVPLSGGNREDIPALIREAKTMR